MFGITNLWDTTSKGEIIHEWETVDRGVKSSRNLALRRLELWILHRSGGAGEAPGAHGFYTRESAEAEAERYMNDFDGRGIAQEWVEKRVDTGREPSSG